MFTIKMKYPFACEVMHIIIGVLKLNTNVECEQQSIDIIIAWIIEKYRFHSISICILKLLARSQVPFFDNKSIIWYCA